MKFNILTIATSTFLSMVMMGQSAVADGDFPRDEYLMGINWVQAPRVNFSEPLDVESVGVENEGLISSRDEYLMGINWKEESLDASVSASRVNFSLGYDDATVDLDMIFPEPEH